MGLWKSLGGTVRAELTSADPAGALTAIGSAGMELYDTVQTGDLTVELTLARRDYRKMSRMLQRRGETLRLLRRSGLYWAGKSLLRRPLLLTGIGLLLAMVLFLPTRIFFVRVEGNETVPARLILEKAEQCGIRFGASRREVRSERMKNALLGAIPELQWAGVNTTGCVATISVRERSEAEQTDRKLGVSSIVAIRDGVIQEATVTRGNALCKVGQAVKAGEVLVSGYTDCGICIQATRAEAEIFAQTQRYLTAVTLSDSVQRGQEKAVEKKYSLRIGKNKINFYKDSGILDSSCDKMYQEYVWTLPGGFELPVALIVEEYTSFDTWTASAEPEAVQDVLCRFAQQYLQAQMVAGQILDRTEVVEGNCLYGKYACVEMIGREQSEEIMQSNGKDN